MKFTGGYNIPLAGRPGAELEVLPEPAKLCIPLWTRRLRFTEIAVEEGRKVEQGQVLARDPDTYSVPLLAPREGTVRLDSPADHITLEEVSLGEEEPFNPDEHPDHVPQGRGQRGMKRFQLKELGAWEFFSEAHTGEVPHPFGQPQAIIVSTLRIEPFLARGDIQLETHLDSFARGLEHLQSLLEYQPICLVLPHVHSDLADRIQEHVRGYAWIRAVTIDLTYPYDNPSLLARKLGFPPAEDSPVWSLDVAGVLAVDRALTRSLPSTVRIAALGGPAAENPRHFKAMAGYPLEDLLGDKIMDPEFRVVNGGVLNGSVLEEKQRGLDSECRGLSILQEPGEAELLGWLRPGADRKAYSNTFLGDLIPGLLNRLDTALHGEKRPCVSCQYCEQVCPVPILPHQIHKYLYQDALEEVEKSRVDLCIDCGLCSYVCPSKIELRSQMQEGCRRIKEELHVEEDQNE